MYRTEELGGRRDKIENEIILEEERVIFVVDKMKNVRLIGMVSELDMWRDEQKHNEEVGEVGYIRHREW